jgi:hypothetical protein
VQPDIALVRQIHREPLGLETSAKAVGERAFVLNDQYAHQDPLPWMGKSIIEPPAWHGDDPHG